MPEFIPGLHKYAIAHRIYIAAKQISGGCTDGSLILLGVFKSVFVSTADLIRQLILNDITIDNMQRTGCAKNHETSKGNHLLKGLMTDGKTKPVIDPLIILANIFNWLDFFSAKCRRQPGLVIDLFSNPQRMSLNKEYSSGGSRPWFHRIVSDACIL